MIGWLKRLFRRKPEPEIVIEETKVYQVVKPLPFDQRRLKELTGRDFMSRNSKCFCGSGKRFKRCCGDKKRRGF